MDDRTHEVLLALAGRIDDDLLAWCRELVAVGEDGRALELITATLAADGTTLPPQDRAALVDAARAARTDLDADAVLRPGGTVEDTPHRFDAGRGIEDLAAAVGALPERLVAGCRTWVTFRSTPAGSAPGPLPQPVVLVEVAADDPRPLDVLAYQLATACARVGAPSAAVEVVVAGAARPEYQQAAVENALPVHGADSAPHTDPYGTAVYRPDPWDAPADTDSFAVQEPVDGPAVDTPYLDGPPSDASRPDGPPSDASYADAAYEDAAAVDVPSVDVPDDERAAAWPALGSLVMPPGPRPVARRSPFPDAGLPPFALSPSDVDESGAGAGPIDPPSGDDERVPTEQTDGFEPRPESEGPFGGTGAGESFGDAGPSTTTGGLRPFGSSVESGPLDWTPGTDLLAPTDLTQSDLARSDLTRAADEPAVGSAAPEPVSAVDDAPSDEIRTGGGRGAPTGDDGDRSAPVTPLRARTEPPRPRPTAVPPLPRPMPSPTPFGRRRPLMPVSDPPVRSLPVASAAADTPALASIGDPFSGPIEERTSPMSSSRREPTIDEADPLGLGRLPVERHPDDDDFPIELPDSSAADSWLADWISGDWAMSRSGSSPDPLGPDSARSDSARSDSAGSDSAGWDAARPDPAASPVAAVGSAVADPGNPDPARRDPAPRRSDAPDPFVGRVEERAAPGPSASAGPQLDRSQSDRSQSDRSQSDRSQSDRSQPDRPQPDRPLPDRWMPDRPVPGGPPSDRSLSDRSLSDGSPSDGPLSGGPVSDRRPSDRSLPERRVPGRSFPVRSVPFAPDRSGPVEPPADQPPSVRRPASRPVPAPQAETPMEQTSFVLPPESVARLSDADRELLARLQSELGDTPRPRVTRRAGIGGNGAPAPNGRGPHPSTPPDMAG